jgi:hypothetical protein
LQRGLWSVAQGSLPPSVVDLEIDVFAEAADQLADRPVFANPGRRTPAKVIVEHIADTHVPWLRACE